jgi:Leucine-rich repeat (LRR) protein
LFDFFKALLIKNAKLTNNDFTQNKYYLNGIKLNLIDNVFDVVNEKAEIIKIMEIPIGVVPKFNDFKNVCHLIITDTGLSELDESIGDLSELKLLALTNNKLKTLPISIGKLSKLVFLNLNGNKMIDFPNEISKLDIKNGGSLIRVGIKKSEIGEKKYNKLKKLLPSAVLI